MKDQYFIACYYHGYVHYCCLWQQEWKKFTKKESVVKFSRVPKIVLTEGEVLEELTTRRRAWISAISRDDLTDDNLENERVCSRHFLSGQAAKQWDQCTYTCGKGDGLLRQKYSVVQITLPVDYLLSLK